MGTITQITLFLLYRLWDFKGGVHLTSLFTTTMIGSYSVPDWYHTLQKAAQAGELASELFNDAKSVATRAAVKDQELAGLDIVCDGELFRRDNNQFGPPNAMIHSFAAKIPGFSKEFRSGPSVAPEADLPAPVIRGKLEPVPLGLVNELNFLRTITDKPVKIAMAGPHMFARIVWDEYYGSPERVAMEMAAVINAELRRLDEAGCESVQIDEPILWFLAQDQEWGIRALNACFAGVKRAKKVLHVCQGNYNPDPDAHLGMRIFPADFSAILPVMQQVDVDLILMAFVSLEKDGQALLKNFPQDKQLGVGVVDVQNHRVETSEEVAQTLLRVASFINPERLWVTPDCGLNHLPRDIAFAKLSAMVSGAQLARELLAQETLPVT